MPSWSLAKSLQAKPTCLALERSFVCFARSCTELNAGRARLARIAIIAITTSNSMRVNAEEVLLIFISILIRNACLIAVLIEVVNSYF